MLGSKIEQKSIENQSKKAPKKRCEKEGREIRKNGRGAPLSGSTWARRGLDVGSAPAGTRARRRWGEGREGGTGKKTCICDLTRRRPEAWRIFILCLFFDSLIVLECLKAFLFF